MTKTCNYLYLPQILGQFNSLSYFSYIYVNFTVVAEKKQKQKKNNNKKTEKSCTQPKTKFHSPLYLSTFDTTVPCAIHIK